MVCFADRKTLMRCTEQLEKKVIPISSTDHIVDFNKFCSISLLFCFVLFFSAGLRNSLQITS